MTTEAETEEANSYATLPDGWCWTAVVDLGHPEEQPVLTGPFGSSLGRTDFVDEGVPLLTIGCLTAHGLSLEKAFYIPVAKAQALARYRVRSGDILFSRMASVGRAELVTRRFEGSIINYHLMRLRLDDRLIDPSFFISFVRGDAAVTEYLRDVNHGATRDGINTTQLLSLPVALAPINEQRRIVARIDALLTRLDASVAALRRVQANLKRYRAAVLAAAAEGRLTAEWRAAHPPSEDGPALLARILAERRRVWEEAERARYAQAGKTPPLDWDLRYREPSAPDTAGLPALPEGWCWATVDQLITDLRNGLSQKPAAAPPGIPILRINAVRPMRVDLEEQRYLDVALAEVQGYLLQDGDILFTRYNGSLELLGVAGLVRSCDRPILHPDKLIRAKVASEPALAHYLEIALNVGASRQHLEGRAHTTAGQTGISGADIKGMPVPLPSLTEQAEIVAEVERRLSAVAHVEARVEASLARAERLRQSILKRAFEGKLAPRDPADEPASALLARILTAREAETQKAQSTRKTRKARGAGATRRRAAERQLALRALE